jgi:hypothetical protein
MVRWILLAAASSLLPAQSVLQVGPGGFTQIYEAAAAAQPGDVIEVATGSYLPFTLAKPLTIRPQPGARVVVPAYYNLHMVFVPPAGSVTKVAGIEFLNPYPFFIGSETRVDGGSVWFEDCIFESAPVYQSGGLSVRNANVVLRDCILVGHRWASNGPGLENPGLLVQNGHVGASHCRFFGSRTALETLGNGGAGVLVQDGSAHLVDCELVGGTAAMCWSHPPGPGLQVAGTSAVWLADCVVRGGDDVCGVGGIGVRNLASAPVRHARTTIAGGNGTGGSGAVSSGPLLATPLLGARGPGESLVRGQLWSVEYRTEPNWPIGVCFGLSLQRRAEPGVDQPVWLPAGGVAELALLVADAQGAASYATTVPAGPALLGVSLFVEAVSGVQLPLQTSPPVGGLVW